MCQVHAVVLVAYIAGCFVCVRLWAAKPRVERLSYLLFYTCRDFTAHRFRARNRQLRRLMQLQFWQLLRTIRNFFVVVVVVFFFLGGGGGCTPLRFLIGHTKYSHHTHKKSDANLIQIRPWSLVFFVLKSLSLYFEWVIFGPYLLSFWLDLYECKSFCLRKSVINSPCSRFWSQPRFPEGLEVDFLRFFHDTRRDTEETEVKTFFFRNRSAACKNNL